MEIPREEFVCEPIIIDSSSVSLLPLSRGAPGCPRRFTWRGQEHNVVAIVETTKQLRAHDSKETYVRSHSFRVRTDTNLEMVLRCDRRVRGNPWRVFTVRQLDG
ncbi:MAG: hypothetical protein GX977_09995 [Firmicutes bacterium]|nr:hypothetical protein [Bacillota bacterium]